MFLRKLYSEPPGLFKNYDVINFKDGINIIFGKKNNKPKMSLNGIGKSTFLDLIDFCLLASPKKRDNPRLYAAREILEKYVIVLEFEVDGKFYTIKRSMSEPGRIDFGSSSKLISYSEKKLKPILFNLIFYDDDYKGIQVNKWFRRLIVFFLKVHKHKREKFSDPIQYIKESTITELNQYQLFLMGINNYLSVENFQNQEFLKKKISAKTEVKRIIEESYELRDINQATKQINRLTIEINALENSISLFKLEDHYKNSEKQANILTAKIKDLWFNNHNEREQIGLYKQSYELGENISTLKVKNIYKDLNILLADNIKKTLEDAINFRKSLSKSRKDFINKEIQHLEQSILLREEEIKILEEERASLFTFLSTKEAIKDLTDAFFILNEKKKALSDIEGQIKLYNDLEKEISLLKIKDIRITDEASDFINEIKNQQAHFSVIFSEIYYSLYPSELEKPIFYISSNPNRTKLDINIDFPDMYAKGKNYGRVLIYDLAILFNSIINKKKGPRFLIHDGIFDGVDKSHFILLYNYLYKMLHETNAKFQYFITINEEGELNEKFGNIANISFNNLADEAILVLTPDDKLFGKDFSAEES